MKNRVSLVNRITQDEMDRRINNLLFVLSEGDRTAYQILEYHGVVGPFVLRNVGIPTKWGIWRDLYRLSLISCGEKPDEWGFEIPDGLNTLPPYRGGKLRSAAV